MTETACSELGPGLKPMLNVRDTFPVLCVAVVGLLTRGRRSFAAT